jgi:hypothetical protein
MSFSRFFVSPRTRARDLRGSARLGTLTSLVLLAASIALATTPACGSDDVGSDADGGTGADGSGGGGGGDGGGGGGGGGTEPPQASCKAGTGGSATVQAPKLELSLEDRDEDGWLGSPAVADLDGDGRLEIVAARGARVVVWNADGSAKWTAAAGNGRIWASPVVGNFAGDAKLEVAVAARDKVYLFDAKGAASAGFPVTFEDELRSLGAGDLDGDGKLDLAAATGRSGPTDVVAAWHGDGSKVAGFPPNASGASGCTKSQAPAPCYLAGAYDQNLAIGDIDGDGKQDVVVPHDNAYASFHKGTGAAFDAAAGFKGSRKTPGVRYLHALDEAQQGYSDTENTSLQAHFTNTAPAIADLDGDGTFEVVMSGSVQNASQSNRKLGVGLWAVHSDASRLAGWETPFHAPEYLSGLEDLGGNLIGETNQVTVADLNPAEKGPEILFAGFDGKIHAVSAAKKDLWATPFTTQAGVLTPGIVVADLSGDGSPEVVFTTYGAAGKGALFVLSAGGQKLHEIALPGRGSMAAPTVADIDGDGDLEILVSLKDTEGKVAVQVYGVPGSQTNCVLWSTGRGNLLRNGWVR